MSSYKRHLNSLAVSYRDGNEDAVDELFMAVAPYIERESNLISYYVDNFVKLDCRVTVKIKNFLEKFDEEKDDYLAVAKTIITRERFDFMNRRKRDAQMVSKDRAPEGTDLNGWDIEDPLARAEDTVLFKEKITLLAEGDHRKELILLKWSEGEHDKNISELLAQRLGGKSESHRKFIGRFKTECKNRLATESIL